MTDILLPVAISSSNTFHAFLALPSAYRKHVRLHCMRYIHATDEVRHIGPSASLSAVGLWKDSTMQARQRPNSAGAGQTASLSLPECKRTALTTILRRPNAAIASQGVNKQLQSADCTGVIPDPHHLAMLARHRALRLAPTMF